MPRIILLNILKLWKNLTKSKGTLFSKDNEESAENAEQSTSEDAKGAPAKKKAAAKEE